MRYLYKPLRPEDKPHDILVAEWSMFKERLELEKEMNARLSTQVKVLKLDLECKNALIVQLKNDMEKLQAERRFANQHWGNKLLDELIPEDLETL